MGGKVVKGLSMRGKKTSGVLERKKTFPCLTSSRLACWSSHLPKWLQSSCPWWPATVVPCKSLLIHTHFGFNPLKMWQQQMTSNHKSSQITQITVSRRKCWAVNHKTDGREVGEIRYLAKCDNVEGHAWRQWTRGDQNPIWQKRTLPSSTVGEAGDDATNVDTCKITCKISLEWNYTKHISVDTWSKYNLASW